LWWRRPAPGARLEPPPDGWTPCDSCDPDEEDLRGVDMLADAMLLGAFIHGAFTIHEPD
jgi:hypothetical protein